MTKEHQVVKEFDRWLADKLVKEYIQHLGYKPVGGSYQVKFFDSKSNEVRIDRITVVVEDPLNPPKEEVKVTEEEAQRIIAESKGLDLDKHKINITNY